MDGWTQTLSAPTLLGIAALAVALILVIIYFNGQNPKPAYCWFLFVFYQQSKIESNNLQD